MWANAAVAKHAAALPYSWLAARRTCGYPCASQRYTANAMMNTETDFAKVLRGLARFSQCSESRAAFSQAAEVIERLVRENQELRHAAPTEGAAQAG